MISSITIVVWFSLISLNGCRSKSMSRAGQKGKSQNIQRFLFSIQHSHNPKPDKLERIGGDDSVAVGGTAEFE